MHKGAAIAAAILALSGCSLLPDKKPVTQMTEAEFRNNYTCPEYLSTTGKNQEINNLIDWAKIHHPEWNMRQTLAFRQQLLDNHHCLTERKGGL